MKASGDKQSTALEDPSKPLTTALVDITVHLLNWIDEHNEQTLVFFREMTSHRSSAPRLLESRSRAAMLVTDYLQRELRSGRLRPIATDTAILSDVFNSSVLFAAIA